MQRKRFYGFDYLRALFSLLVVGWHTNVIDSLESIHIARVVDYNFELLSVPGFITISLFLFYQAADKNTNYFLSKRFPKLLTLYIFWTSLWVAFLVLSGRGYWLFENFFSLKKAFVFILSSGESVYYYLFTLILLTATSHLNLMMIHLIPDRTKMFSQLSLLFCSCLLVLLCSILPTLSDGFGALVKVWNPINFLPCVFVSFLIYQESEKEVKITNGKTQVKLLTLLTIFVLASTLEWIFLGDLEIWKPNALPEYARISLVFGSWLLVYLSILVKSNVPKPVRFLSDLSLGIYCLHYFFVKIFSCMFSSNIIVFTFSLIFSVSLTYILRKIEPLKSII